MIAPHQTNKLFTAAVDEGDFPSGSMVPLDDPFVDDRGVIQNLLLTPVTSVAVITSKKGTVRSNHYHKSDWHYIYVVSGRLVYSEREVDGSSSKSMLVVPGQMFFTGPMKVHKVEFLEDSTIMTFAKNVRSHESHEEDLVRMEF